MQLISRVPGDIDSDTVRYRSAVHHSVFFTGSPGVPSSDETQALSGETSKRQVLVSSYRFPF